MLLMKRVVSRDGDSSPLVFSVAPIQRAFGKHGFNTSEIGFGAWAIGGSWGEQGDADSLEALHRALDPRPRTGKRKDSP